jgi:hypothetical protein
MIDDVYDGIRWVHIACACGQRGLQSLPPYLEEGTL